MRVKFLVLTLVAMPFLAGVSQEKPKARRGPEAHPSGAAQQQGQHSVVARY
jgi:hypothetical protein